MNINELSNDDLLLLYKQTKTNVVKFHNEQMAIKILMNSLYGAIANIYFLYYIMEMAEAITMNGQLAVKVGAKAINEYLDKVLKIENFDYVIYIDTDSAHVNLDPLVRKVFGDAEVPREVLESFLDSVAKEKIQPVLEKAYNDLAIQLGVFKNESSMKREKIADKAIFTGKKRYIYNVWNSEGVHYDIPKISVTGIESVRSSTPEICRDKFDEAFSVIMNKDEVAIQEFIKKFKEEFKKLPADIIARNSGTDDIEKYMDTKTLYRKGCPQHVRGAIVYNAKLKELGLTDKHETIKSGDKVKTLYLKLPNPVRENIISFVGTLPKELNLDKYIDYETQYEKVFLAPLINILEAVGWTHEEMASLDNFFI